MRKLTKEKKKNVLVKVSLDLYTDISLKYLNAKLLNPNMSKNDFLVYVLKKGIERIEEEGDIKNEWAHKKKKRKFKAIG